MANEEVAVNHSFPPKIDDIFFGYKLEDCLKSSSNCVVHVCYHITDKSKTFVVKIGVKSEAKKLSNEIKWYKVLSGGEGIPKLIFYERFVDISWVQSEEEWVEDDWTMIVIERLNPIFAKTSPRFAKITISLEELVPMAVQQLSLLEFIHSKGLVHKGVKPDNFVMSDDKTKVYIIDFNKSKRYLDSEGNHVSFQTDNKLPKGLPLFHSLNYHKGIRSSRRDDLESLGYCWVYLLMGCLPWSKINRIKRRWSEYVRSVGYCKTNTTIEELCKELPQNSRHYLIEYFKMCHNLGFSEEPDYKRMRLLISGSIDCNNNQ